MRLGGATTTIEEIISAVLGALIGGSGLVGLLFFYIRHFIDKRMKARETEDAKRRATRIRRLKIEDEWYHSAGRLFFYIHKYIETGQHNGDLESAWQAFLKAEAEKKDLDREILAERELDH